MKPYTWRAAILKSSLMPTTRHVLLTLSCYVNDVGQSAYPATLTLASDTGLSERAVITHLQLARDAGWLKIAKHGYGGQKWARNEYFPTCPAVDYEESPHEKGTEHGSVAPENEEKALNLTKKGTEPNAKGTEPKRKKALKEVQSNSPMELSKELSKEKTTDAPPKPARAAKANPAAPVVVLPDWLPESAWGMWVNHRVAIKSPLTQDAADLCIKRLAKLRAEGNDPVLVIEASVMTGKWTGLFPLSADARPAANAPAGRPAKFDPNAYVNSGAAYVSSPAPARPGQPHIIDGEFVERAP
ncbi:MAG: helix-turn-helix domain-containing protein [Telluria sp.]